MPPKKKSTNTTPIDTVKHKDKRVNIPTEELRNFVKEDEAKPKTILYPRDPSLDPQLVWKGKDEQDAKDLAVPAVPIYIQEKIHPQAVIENVRAEAKKDKPEAQASLFADFNGIKFEDLIDFYQHEQNWSNRMVLGDSLLVMTSLAEKEGLKGKVQMIYFYPPYGIKFDSNWQVSTRNQKVTDGKSEGLTRQPEQIRAFRDTWQLGIHSYLAYLRDRLVIARELLTETGSCFVQIGDENVHLIRSLMDEVLGSENFVAIIRFRKKTMPLGSTFLERMGDFIVWYAKDVEAAKSKYRQIYIKQNYEEDFHWANYELPDGTRRKVTDAQIQGGYEIPAGSKQFRLVSLWPASFNQNAVFKVDFRGKEWWPADGQCWPTSPEGIQKLIWADQIEPEGQYLRKVLYLEGAEHAKLTTDWADTIGARDKNYVVETSPMVIERCLLMTTDPGDLVLDPTCGSGTTAYVAEQWGRRWITIDTSRVALALARTRLMAAKYPYYYLADSPDGVKKDTEVTGKLPPDYKTEGDIKKGFVYKRVPHVTLKSIANNPDIKEGMKREEIDAAISKHADTETLYDQPYEDNKRIRVTGPFTVESLSPHRVLATDEERPATEKAAQKVPGAGQFETMILDNLKKAGVQNTVKGERLKFERLEPYAGEWLHFVGEYSEKGGASKRVAVCIGPEHGTVGHELIKEAAKEAIKGVGFDLLVVCGFAFDAHANETANQFAADSKKASDKIVAEGKKLYGRLPILLARMNPA